MQCVWCERRMWCVHYTFAAVALLSRTAMLLCCLACCKHILVYTTCCSKNDAACCTAAHRAAMHRIWYEQTLSLVWTVCHAYLSHIMIKMSRGFLGFLHVHYPSQYSHLLPFSEPPVLCGRHSTLFLLSPTQLQLEHYSHSKCPTTYFFLNDCQSLYSRFLPRLNSYSLTKYTTDHLTPLLCLQPWMNTLPFWPNLAPIEILLLLY